MNEITPTNDNSTVQSMLRQHWRDGYQEAVDAMRLLAHVRCWTQHEQELIVRLANLLQGAKP